MLSGDHDVMTRCLQWILDNLDIDSDTTADLPRALEIVMKYQDLPADLADASLVALCERRDTNLVASIDSDLNVYRMRKSKKLENVFFSAS